MCCCLTHVTYSLCRHLSHPTGPHGPVHRCRRREVVSALTWMSCSTTRVVLVEYIDLVSLASLPSLQSGPLISNRKKSLPFFFFFQNRAKSECEMFFALKLAPFWCWEQNMSGLSTRRSHPILSRTHPIFHFNSRCQPTCVRHFCPRNVVRWQGCGVWRVD